MNAKRITGGLRHLIVIALSLGLFLVGCGYTPTARQFDGVPRAIIQSEAFQAAEAALAEQGVTLTEVIVASSSAAVLATSQSNLVVQVLYDEGGVWSVVSIEVTGETFTLVNYYSDLVVAGTLAELQALSALGDASHEEIQALSSAAMIDELSRALGVPQHEHELSVLCAACSAEQEMLNDAMRDEAAAAYDATIASATVAATCLGAANAPACLIATANLTRAIERLTTASQRARRANQRLGECFARNCGAAGGGTGGSGSGGGGGGGSGGGRP